MNGEHAAKRQTDWGDRWRERPTTILLVTATVVVLVAVWVWLDAVRLRSAALDVRSSAAIAATPVAGGLAGVIAKRLALVRGLGAFVTVELSGDGLDDEFPAFAEALRASMPGIRNITVAPDFVVRLVNPMDAGHEKVVGHDLLKDPRPGFPDTVRRAISTRDVATHGPVELLQGGIGLIARQILFKDGKPWGAVGAAFDLPPILNEANLAGLTQRYRVALRRTGGMVFAGEEAVLGLDPVVERIPVADGDWELAVVPMEGWAAAARAQAGRGPLVLAVGGVGILVITVVLLLAERRATLARLVELRTAELDHARRDADRKAQQLALAQKELEQFAFAAAHDLQEPVRAMGSYAQLLQREIGASLDEERAALLVQVVEGARRLKALLSDVQIFVAETGIPLPDRPVQADDALDDALAALARTLDRVGGRVRRDPLPRVMADRRRLREMFVVLIGNALEYRHPDRPPDIHIGAREDGAFVVLTVRDNGIGIEPRYHEQIFEVFRRLHGRTEHSGTGMGLPIARKMAERLGGRITVSSDPGQGSAFSIHLPAVNQEAGP
ncbi:sensor histidine kinase [Azospirillum rugosum]|uniref:histidine kinase n=1 Tax=Azospirillum rugosum TaxID=416170 RepID=A0ABS4SFX7_9PROT|nr:ATP-binding protein [Azospirillum rugosum]MBP2291466.1 signal transduction histidine kinase [Azospirillum rugosum]MDQ0525254.1 signal transduction histidine kinase [Azospirillum rugosum]